MVYAKETEENMQYDGANQRLQSAQWHLFKHA
jgi:hypothetical protein